MLRILETLSQNSSRINGKRALDSPARPQTKRVKSVHLQLEIPEGVDQSLYCSEYLRDIAKELTASNSNPLPEECLSSEQDPKKFFKSRKKLLNWLIPICKKYRSDRHVVYKMVQLMDIYFAKNIVPQDQMQLVGSVALLMSSKYHDMIPVPFEWLVNHANGAFTYSNLTQCEADFLVAIDFTMTNPLIIDFVDWFLINFSKEKHQKALKRVCYYLAECLLLEKSLISSPPKFVATIVVYWGLQMVSRTKWNNRFDVLFEGTSEEDLQQHAATILRNAFPKFGMTSIQTYYFDKFSVIGKIFRNKELKSWLGRRSERYSKRTKSLLLSGS